MGSKSRVRNAKLTGVGVRGSRRRLPLIGVMPVLIFLQCICARAQPTNFPNTFAIGVHSGFSTSEGKKLFLQNELYANWGLPVDWRMGSHWHLRPHLELTAGYLKNIDDGFIGSLGP